MPSSSSVALEKSTVAHPFFKTRNPRAYRPRVRCAQAEPMSAAAVDVQFCRNSRPLETQVGLGQTFRNVFAVGVRAGEKDRRITIRRLDFPRCAGINHRLEIRARRLPLDWIARVTLAGIEAFAGEVHQLAARRKTNRADARRINSPFGRPAANQTHGALCVSQRLTLDLISGIGFTRQPALKHEGSDAMLA